MKLLLIILIQVPAMPTYEVQVGTFNDIKACQEAARTHTVLKRTYSSWHGEEKVTPMPSTTAYCKVQ